VIPALKNLNFFSIHSARFSTHKKNDNCLSKCVHDNKKKCVNFWENFHSEFRCANFCFGDFLMMWSMMRKAKNKKKMYWRSFCYLSQPNQTSYYPPKQNSLARLEFWLFFNPQIAKLFSIELLYLSQSWISKPTWICHFCDWLKTWKKMKQNMIVL